MNKKKDLLAAGLLLLIAIALIAGIPTIKQRTAGIIGPKFMPILVVIFLLILAAIIGIPAILSKGEESVQEKTPEEKDHYTIIDLVFDRYATITVWVVLIGYALLMKPLGFIPSSILLIFLLCILLSPKSERHYVRFAVLAVFSSFLIYFVFVKLFLLLLPKGIMAGIL